MNLGDKVGQPYIEPAPIPAGRFIKLEPARIPMEPFVVPEREPVLVPAGATLPEGRSPAGR